MKVFLLESSFLLGVSTIKLEKECYQEQFSVWMELNMELKCEPELMYDHINENGKTIKKLQEANN